MPDALTPTEKHSIEYHLGWVQDTQVLAMSGNVTVHQVLSLLRSNIEKTTPDKVYRVREALCECQKVQDQLKGIRERFGVTQVGNTSLDNREAIELLENEYTRWTDKLADMYGGHKNAYSAEHQRIGGIPSGIMESY